MPEILKIVLFLLWCNFLPPLSNFIFGERFSFPLDAHIKWFDNKPLFGPHKTLRGLLFAVVGGALCFQLLGVDLQVAGVAALLAMAGDLLSSFIKRRLVIKSGDSAPLLDQFFEGLFPVLYLQSHLFLTWKEVVLVLAIFLPLTYIGSWFWRFLVFRPPAENYPRMIRSAVRWREWRACHEPIARWQKWFNFENFFYYRLLMARLFKFMGTYDEGVRNALDVQIKTVEFSFLDLPREFDGFRILFLVDLHLDGMEGLTEIVVEKIKELEVDICIVGGDVRMEIYGPIAPAVRKLRKLLKNIKAEHGAVGVLGNHDCIEMVPDLEDAGMMMLVNDSYDIEINGRKIWIVGVDDPHYYKVHDTEKAFKAVPENSFVIFVAHSPEAYKDAASYSPNLYLCGHTHGGQIRLPNRGPLFTHSSAPRFTAHGKWKHAGMAGYTSSGVGASGIPLRFNCPPEITLITLSKKKAE